MLNQNGDGFSFCLHLCRGLLSSRVSGELLIVVVQALMTFIISLLFHLDLQSSAMKPLILLIQHYPISKLAGGFSSETSCIPLASLPIFSRIME